MGCHRTCPTWHRLNGSTCKCLRLSVNKWKGVSEMKVQKMMKNRGLKHLPWLGCTARVLRNCRQLNGYSAPTSQKVYLEKCVCHCPWTIHRTQHLGSHYAYQAAVICRQFAKISCRTLCPAMK